jgi:hypothetical protein
VADPLVAGQYGKAAFDAVGPLLLIGWAEVGPDLLRALTNASQTNKATSADARRTESPFADEQTAVGQTAQAPSRQSSLPSSDMLGHDLLEHAREADARHWEEHRRPISADTLRRKLRIGAARSRLLVAIIRADPQQRSTPDEDEHRGDPADRRTCQ